MGRMSFPWNLPCDIGQTIIWLAMLVFLVIYAHQARQPTLVEAAGIGQMKLSVIIPVHNGGLGFEQCLEALTVSIRLADEIIVVDDASTDVSAVTALAAGVQVISVQGQPRGPAFARNRGAQEAHGDILVFLDADVAVHKDTLARIAEYFIEHSEVAAVFGSYDDNPPKRSVVSLYKNLQHHYVHQHGNQVSSTFWAGCGAIRRNYL